MITTCHTLQVKWWNLNMMAKDEFVSPALHFLIQMYEKHYTQCIHTPTKKLGRPRFYRKDASKDEFWWEVTWITVRIQGKHSKPCTVSILRPLWCRSRSDFYPNSSLCVQHDNHWPFNREKNIVIILILAVKNTIQLTYILKQYFCKIYFNFYERNHFIFNLNNFLLTDVMLN